MLNYLKEKLKAYITVNNPDLLVKLQNDNDLNGYLERKVSAGIRLILDLLAEDKPGYVIEELVMQQMTADLRPSRYNYILEILKGRFETHYQRLSEIGMLSYVTLEILTHSGDVFDQQGFSEKNKENACLEALIRIRIRDYFIQ
ncbi:hypothetical protein [Taibaiella koreensis]|uniref:hypothetical protein n=1 Tax=Taibaiella koreensis TaxID=1268548 RepID=UPI000E599753|nr:hypothetical protein [Taibaiella koreensis]